MTRRQGIVDVTNGNLQSRLPGPQGNQNFGRRPTNASAEHQKASVAMSTVVFVEFLAILAFGAIYVSGVDRAGFSLVGLLCAWFTHLPFLSQRLSVFSMWGALSLVVTVGAGLRGILLTLGYPSTEVLDALFLRGKTFPQLLGPSLVAVMGVGLLSGGFALGHSTAPSKREERATSRWSLDIERISGRAVLYLVASYAVVGLYATYRYYRAVGGASATISERRTTYTGHADYESHAGLELLANAGVVALFLYVAYRISLEKRFTLGSWALLLSLAACAFSINWVTTTRADLLYASYGVLAVVVVVRRRIRAFVVATVALCVVLGIGALSAIRSGGTGGEGVSLTFALDSGLLNRNAFDLSKTLLIVDAVPDVLPYQKGATMTNYLFAPIPRSIWPEKPVVSPGPIIGSTIYGLKQTGVPPGAIAELVWNFGRTGGLMLVPFLGLLLGRLEGIATRLRTNSLLHLVLYGFIAIPFGKSIVGVAVGQAFSQALQGFALLVPLVIASGLFSKPLDRRSRTKARGHGLRQNAGERALGRSVIGNPQTESLTRSKGRDRE